MLFRLLLNCLVQSLLHLSGLQLFSRPLFSQHHITIDLIAPLKAIILALQINKIKQTGIDILFTPCRKLHPNTRQIQRLNLPFSSRGRTT